MISLARIFFSIYFASSYSRFIQGGEKQSESYALAFNPVVSLLKREHWFPRTSPSIHHLPRRPRFFSLFPGATGDGGEGSPPPPKEWCARCGAMKYSVGVRWFKQFFIGTISPPNVSSAEMFLAAFISLAHCRFFLPRGGREGWQYVY